MFNFNGRFRKGQLDIKSQATKAMYSLTGKCSRCDLPVDMQLWLFNAMVLPVMIYAREIWRYNAIRELEILHMNFLKHVLCVHKSSSTDIVLW